MVADFPLLAKARALYARLEAEAAANEALGRLGEATIAALRSGDFFALSVPKSLGGLEAGLVEQIAVVEEISRADASTGWVLMACLVGTGSAAAYLAPEAAREMFSRGIALAAGEGAPRGRADVEGDGYRLSGEWGYGSGILHADYIHTGAIVYENGAPRLIPGTRTPESYIFIVPARHATFHGNWDVLGLRATGSVDYALKDVFVPAAFCHRTAATEPNHGGHLYRIGILGMATLGHSAFTLGLGRRALDELAALARAEEGRPSAIAEVGGDAGFRAGYALAEAGYRAARALIYESWSDLEASLARGETMSRRQLTLLRLALLNANQALEALCTFAHRHGGGISLRSGTHQRLFRDAFSASQHRIVSDAGLRDCGEELLDVAGDKVWTLRGLTALA